MPPERLPRRDRVGIGTGPGQSSLERLRESAVLGEAGPLGRGYTGDG
jgi:hypothetical protein